MIKAPFITIEASDEEEWLRVRKQYITASDLAAVLGISKYKTANKVLASKKSEDKDPMNPVHARRGHILEPACAKAVAYDHKWLVAVQAFSNVIEMWRAEGTSLICTPDAFVVRFGEELAVLECKSSGTKRFDKLWRTGNPPIEYVAQTYAQMMCLELQEGYLAAINTREVEVDGVEVVDVSLALYKLTRNDVLDELVVQGVDTFEQAWNIDKKDFIKISSKFSSKVESNLLKQLEFVGVTELHEYQEGESVDAIY